MIPTATGPEGLHVLVNLPCVASFAGQALLRPDFVTPTCSQCQKLRNKDTNTSSAIPALPATAPCIAIEGAAFDPQASTANLVAE